MQTKELATDRIRAYPSDGKKLRIAAKRMGGKTTPADIVRLLIESAPKISLTKAGKKINGN